MQPKYFPWCGYFALAAQADVFVHLDSVQLSRPSSMTRCQVADRNGRLQWLSVDISREPSGQNTLNLVFPDDRHGWRRRHVAACTNLYGGSTYAREWLEEFSELLLTTQGSLADLNIATTSWIGQLLEIEPQQRRASAFLARDSRLGRLEDICKSLSATAYLASPRAREYMAREGVEHKLGSVPVHFLDYRCSAYEAGRGGRMIPGLSILDHLAWLGIERTRDHILAQLEG